MSACSPCPADNVTLFADASLGRPAGDMSKGNKVAMQYHLGRFAQNPRKALFL